MFPTDGITVTILRMDVELDLWVVYVGGFEWCTTESLEAAIQSAYSAQPPPPEWIKLPEGFER